MSNYELLFLNDERMREAFFREGYTISMFDGFMRYLRKSLRLSRKYNNCEDTATKTEINEQLDDISRNIVSLYEHFEDMFDIVKRYPYASPEVLAQKAMRESEYAYFYRI